MLRPLATLAFLALVLIASAAAAFQADDPAKPINIEKFNTADDESDPYVTPDNLGFLFATNRNKQWEIFLSKRGVATAAWPAPALYSNDRQANLRTPFFRQGFVFFSADIVPDEFIKLKNYDLFKRVEQGAPIPILGVCEKTDESRPWITASGGEYFFSRKTKEGWKQFVAPGPIPGPIGKGKDVGLDAGFSHGVLTTNGLVMYLQGPVDGAPGQAERLGLFKTTRSRIGGPWAPPVELKKVNSSEGKRGDMAPCISSDGNRLYFASDRPGGRGGLDLWLVYLDKLK